MQQAQKRIRDKVADLACVTLAFIVFPLPTIVSAARSSSPKLEILLQADPIRAPNAKRIKLTGGSWIIGNVMNPGKMPARHSTLQVHNSAGRIVFTKEDVFIPRNSGNGGIVVSEASGYGGPSLPTSLAPGNYVAVWTIDDQISNPASFTIGSGEPQFLTLESLEKGHDACLLLHVYNSGPKSLDFCSAVMGINILIDGQPRTTTAAGCTITGSAGHPMVAPKDGFSIELSCDRNLMHMKGNHKVSAEYKGHRSSEVEVICE
jgi:hypothetical protein